MNLLAEAGAMNWVDVPERRSLDANTDTAGNAAFSGTLVASFTAAGQLMLVGDVLYGNTDADTDAEFSIQLLGITTLNAADLVL